MSEKGYAGAVSVKRIGTDWYWAQLSSVAWAGGRAGLQRGEDGMGRGLMLFSDERSMVCCFTMHLREASSPWGIVRLGTEFYYQRGRADVVAVLEDGTVIAFEAKLKRWKDALRQAYRNLCFADASFVVTPREIAPIWRATRRNSCDSASGCVCIGRLYRDHLNRLLFNPCSRGLGSGPWSMCSQGISDESHS